MANMKKDNSSKEIQVLEITRGRVEFCLVGSTPLILNRLSDKAGRELLMPRKKTAAEKASSLKHNPFIEYRASAYRDSNPEAPTLLMHPSTAFKSALRSAAVDIPGSAAKSQIGRLSYVEGDYVHIYGVPKLYMAIVRNSDIARTPDVRTRVIVPRWACRLCVSYITPVLKEQAVANLMAAAGMIQGVGDNRTEKGKGDYGQWRLADADDPEFLDIVKNGGRAEQKAALDDPQCYDAETADLLTWFVDEAKARGFKEVV